MILEVGLLAEAARTDGAAVGPRAGVHVHVRFQVARRGKGFCAQGTLVWLLLKTEVNGFKNTSVMCIVRVALQFHCCFRQAKIGESRNVLNDPLSFYANIFKQKQIVNQRIC